MKVVFILNDAPYVTERSYNALRLALALARRGGSELKIFLMADAVACAKHGQTTPEGTYNVERMLHGCLAKGVEIGACGSCMDSRSMADADLLEGAHRSSMDELAEWTTWADQVQVW